MRRFVTIWLAAMAMAPAWGQAFPFEDAFTDYAPGHTGAPAWSILAGSFHTENGALVGPVTLRFNARPPQQYVADLTLSFTGPRPLARVALNHQHQADTGVSDLVSLMGSGSEVLLGSSVAPAEEGAPSRERATVAFTGEPLSLRVVVDSLAGRHAVFLNGEALITGAPLEYAAGLFAVELGEGASLDRIVLRVPTADEKRALMFTTLLNDPRDVADGDGGNLLVLHRGSPAVLTITPDGEVTRTFGRRAPGGIPDPVALARGARGEILVLNRFPGEVVVFERNGGIRHRFGKGVLREPSDLTVMPDGTVYVADPAAGAVAVFASDRRYLGAVTSFGGAEGPPLSVGHDTFGNLVVIMECGRGVATLRPGPDRVSMALVSRVEAPVTDVATLDGRMYATVSAGVVDWTRLGGPRFRASSVGGFGAGGRLAAVGESLYALDRAKSRLVVVPPDLADAEPSIFYQNLAQTAALVRWRSAQPTREARVRVDFDGRPLVFPQAYPEATDDHQVLVTGLKPGRTYRYTVSPTSPTIPPSDWSIEYTFSTDPAPSGPVAPGVPAPEERTP